MGIHGLSKLLGDQAPQCVRQQKLKSFFSRKIAVDASMHIYQFLVVVGRQGEQQLTNEAGEVTSHLQGMFYRTVRMLEEGIKPVYVFDGKPPELKLQQLALRTGRRVDAAEGLAEAKEKDDAEAIEKYSKRSVKVTREHNEDCKRLLRLMGVPVVEAPSEAEAQCASMAKAGLVYGVATEDMDCLTFGSPRVIRHLMSGGKENDIMVFEREAAIEQLGLTDDQFIDLCILCGCDYCPSIKGIGPVSALKLIKQHGNLAAALAALQAKGTELPELYPHEQAHAFFAAPEVTKAEDLPQFKWGTPDEDGLVQFLAHEKNFSEERVRNGVKRIVKNKEKANQGRLEAFFGPVTVQRAVPKGKPAAEKDTKGKDTKKGGGKLGGVKGGVSKGPKAKDTKAKGSKGKGKEQAE